MMVKSALYDVLGIDKDASAEEIDQAYVQKIIQLPNSGIVGWFVRQFCFSYHIDYAYDILSNSEKRKIYDAEPGHFDLVTPIYLGF